MHSNFVIRKIKLTDLTYSYFKMVSSLLYINMSELSYGKNKEYMQLLNDNHMVYVIVDTLKDNKIVGSATLLIEQKLSHSYKQVGHIEDVVIDDEYRGQKLGKWLISHLTDIAHMKNCYKCILNCAKKNIVFYEKCGYTYKNNVEMSVYF